MRNTAKLMLNSLFGRLILKPRNVSTIFLTQPNDLKFYLNSSVHKILDIYSANDDYVILTWKLMDNDKGEEIELNSEYRKAQNKNVCLTSGVQTTTFARLHLYSEIERLAERCMYMDTVRYTKYFN